MLKRSIKTKMIVVYVTIRVTKKTDIQQSESFSKNGTMAVIFQPGTYEVCSKLISSPIQTMKSVS